MTRVLLVCPPYSPFTPTESAVPPLGLARLAAMIRADANVRILDMGCEEALGIDSWTHLIRLVDSFQPEILGIGPVVTSSVKKGEEIARIAKSVPHPPVVVIGGPDPTFTFATRLDTCQDIDAVFIGEAELSFPEFVRNWQDRSKWGSSKGLVFRGSATIISTGRRPLSNTEFNQLPVPAWDLMPLDQYREVAKRGGLEPYLPIESSRGCPFDCIFCACSQLFARSTKYRSPESVVSEIHLNAKQYGYRRFVFNDDNAALNSQHITLIATELLRRPVDGLQLACSATVEAGIFADDSQLGTLQRAGFREIFMGCESPHPETIAAIGKTHQPELWPDLIRSAVESCRKNQIASRTNWILGLPTDTKEKFLRTIKFIQDLKPDTALLSLLQPYPGTRLTQMMQDSPEFLGVYPITTNPSQMIASKFDPVVVTRWMSRDEMITLAYKFIRSLGHYCEANVSGSPYYVFELWRNRQGV